MAGLDTVFSIHLDTYDYGNWQTVLAEPFQVPLKACQINLFVPRSSCPNDINTSGLTLKDRTFKVKIKQQGFFIMAILSFILVQV